MLLRGFRYLSVLRLHQDHLIKTDVMIRKWQFDPRVSNECHFVISLMQDLTMADIFMVGVYGFIFVSFIVTIIMLRLQRDNYFYFADVFYSYTEWLVRNTIYAILSIE